MNMEFKTQIPRDTQAIDSLLLTYTHTHMHTHLQQQSHSGTYTIYTPAVPCDAEGAEQGEARKRGDKDGSNRVRRISGMD